MEALKEVTTRGIDDERERLESRVEELTEKIERFQDLGLPTFMVAMELGRVQRSLSFIQRVQGDRD